MTDSGPGSQEARRRVMGVLLAGGQSRRFGENKALAPFRGRPMAAWALDSLREVFPVCGVVANDPAVSEVLGIPGRGDTIPGLGPLGGLATALEWAGEEGFEAAFLLACDLPLVTPALVGRILDRWPQGAGAVVPESPGPLGMEPLCAGYRVAVLSKIRRVAQSPRRSMEAVLRALDTHRIPMPALGSAEELSAAFTNVNTRAQAQELERMEGET